MNILAKVADERVLDVRWDEHSLIVDLMDGRTISVPLAWSPRLFHASAQARTNWKLCAGGYGIHWPEIDEDLSTEGLLRGAAAPQSQLSNTFRIKKTLGARGFVLPKGFHERASVKRALGHNAGAGRQSRARGLGDRKTR